MTQKRLFALGAHEMLDVPVLAERGDDSLLDRATTCAANRNSHAIVATQAVKLVHIVRSKARATLDLASCRVQLDTAAGAVEVIAVVNLTAESQRSSIDEPMALLARILADLRRLD